MSTEKLTFGKLFTMFMAVFIVMTGKYYYDQSQLEPDELTTDSFIDLVRNMNDRIATIPDSVKRRINHSDNSFENIPHQASYRALMHLNNLYSGNAITVFSRDCDNWYRSYSVQLKSTNLDNTLFDYQANRMESLSGHRAEVQTNVTRWFNDQRDDTQETLRFRRLSDTLELSSNGETLSLDAETKLNIQSSRYILRQIEAGNYHIEFESEPDDFSESSIRNIVTAEPYTNEPILNQLWVLKTEEYKDRGEGYALSSTTIELVNNRAIALYAATLGDDGLLYELILNDFEYLADRCMKSTVI